ncbi:MAG TPA: carboxypeptidase-like regulatory domain-containing protein [Acidimicrobiia bacterium]
MILVVACGQPPEVGFEVTGVALAGPVCPVETNPPDPACAPRPVVAAVIEALNSAGSSVASTSTGDDGRFRLTLPEGQYTIVASAVEGLMGTPSPLTVTVSGPTDVGVLSYDTGIR